MIADRQKVRRQTLTSINIVWVASDVSLFQPKQYIQELSLIDLQIDAHCS